MSTYTLKMMIIGSSEVGKTRLLSEYVKEYESTVGANHGGKQIEINGHLVKLTIYDLEGKPRFECIRPDFYKGARAVMYVFDLNKPETLQELPDWIQEYNENSNSDNVLTLLIGNKSDLEIKVTDEQVNSFIKKNPKANILDYIKTSALKKVNIEEAFKYLPKKFIETQNKIKRNVSNL